MCVSLCLCIYGCQWLWVDFPLFSLSLPLSFAWGSKGLYPWKLISFRCHTESTHPNITERKQHIFLLATQLNSAQRKRPSPSETYSQYSTSTPTSTDTICTTTFVVSYTFFLTSYVFAQRLSLYLPGEKTFDNFLSLSWIREFGFRFKIKFEFEVEFICGSCGFPVYWHLAFNFDCLSSIVRTPQIFPLKSKNLARKTLRKTFPSLYVYFL